MKITSDEIQQSLNKVWPDLEQIWCFDTSYEYPTISDLAWFLSENWIDISAIKAANPDCDDFALQQHARIKLHHNWSFGEAFANKVQGWSSLHNLNICCCQEGVFLIDAKKKMTWAASSNENVLWARF